MMCEGFHTGVYMLTYKSPFIAKRLLENLIFFYPSEKADLPGDTNTRR